MQLRSDELNSLRAIISERDATITKLRGEIFLASLNLSTVQIIIFWPSYIVLILLKVLGTGCGLVALYNQIEWSQRML